MKNKKDHNNKLKDLLQRAALDKPEDTGEFEKEALEGFALLESEAEAFHLKNSLDSRITKEVFNAKKQDSQNLYWLLAAMLIGVIGFSVYLFQTFFGISESNLAIQNTSHQQAKEKQQNILISPIEANEALQNKQKLPNGTDQKNNETKTNSSAQTAEGLTNALHTEETEVVSSSKADAAPRAMMHSKDEEGAVAEEPNKGEKNIDDQKAIPAITEDIASGGNEMRSKSGQAENDSKKTKRAEKEVLASPSAPPSAVSVKAVAEGSAINDGVYYKGGESQLNKDLKEKLMSQQLLQKFDALLSLNKNAEVVKVKLTNTYGLSPLEQKKLIDLLKTLDQFSVNGVSGKTKLLEYTLEFRP